MKYEKTLKKLNDFASVFNRLKGDFFFFFLQGSKET